MTCHHRFCINLNRNIVYYDVYYQFNLNVLFNSSYTAWQIWWAIIGGSGPTSCILYTVQCREYRKWKKRKFKQTVTKYWNSRSVFVKIDWVRPKWHCPFHEMSLPPLKIDVDYGWSSKLSSVRCQTENSFHVMSLQSMIQNWNKISKHFLIPAWQQQQH